MKYGSMGNDSHLYEICAVCGGRRGLHNCMNQRCPVDINANGDHTEYRDTVFKSIQSQSPSSGASVLVEALEEITRPIDFMRKRLEEGEQLNGVYAIQLSNDANYLKDIAKKALENYKSGDHPIPIEPEGIDEMGADPL